VRFPSPPFRHSTLFAPVFDLLAVSYNTSTRVRFPSPPFRHSTLLAPVFDLLAVSHGLVPVSRSRRLAFFGSTLAAAIFPAPVPATMARWRPLPFRSSRVATDLLLDAATRERNGGGNATHRR